jgi:hypothetical protein
MSLLIFFCIRCMNRQGVRLAGGLANVTVGMMHVACEMRCDQWQWQWQCWTGSGRQAGRQWEWWASIGKAWRRRSTWCDEVGIGWVRAVGSRVFPSLHALFADCDWRSGRPGLGPTNP